MESCRGITCLLRTNNFVIVLGSEFARESPWHITLHSFSSSAVLGENQKKFVLFMLKAVMYSARNHGYRDCREAPTQPHQVQPQEICDLYFGKQVNLYRIQRTQGHSILFHFTNAPYTSASFLLPEFPLIPQRPFHTWPLLLLLMKAVCI